MYEFRLCLDRCHCMFSIVSTWQVDSLMMCILCYFLLSAVRQWILQMLRHDKFNVYIQILICLFATHVCAVMNLIYIGPMNFESSFWQTLTSGFVNDVYCRAESCQQIIDDMSSSLQTSKWRLPHFIPHCACAMGWYMKWSRIHVLSFAPCVSDQFFLPRPPSVFTSCCRHGQDVCAILGQTLWGDTI